MEVHERKTERLQTYVTEETCKKFSDIVHKHNSTISETIAAMIKEFIEKMDQ